MIVNNNIPQAQPTEPKKKFSAKKSYEWLNTFNKEHGNKLTEGQIAQFSKDPKFWFRDIYGFSGVKMPSQLELDNIYDSFLMEESPEKGDMGRVLNTAEATQKKKNLELQSSLAQDVSSLASQKKQSKTSKPPQQPQGDLRDEEFSGFDQYDIYQMPANFENAGKVDWARIKNEKAPVKRGSSEQAIVEYNEKYKIYISEQRMLEEAERDLGEDFWLRPKIMPDNPRMFNEDANVSMQIENQDASFFNMTEDDAESEFNTTYGRFGFSAKQTGVASNKLLITAPNGETKEVQLFTPAYKMKAGVVGDELYREQVQRNNLLDWMKGSASQSFDFLYDGLQNDNPGFVKQFVELKFNDGLYNTVNKDLLNDVDMAFLYPTNQSLGFNYVMAEQYLQSALFDAKRNLLAEKQKSKVDYVSAGGRPVSYSAQPQSKRDAKARVENLQGEYDRYISQKEVISQNIGHAFLNTGKYRDYDFANNEESVRELALVGLSPLDMPLEQIRLNGKASTAREVQTIMGDVSMLADIREGRIDIQIDDKYEFGSLTMQNVVAQAKALQKRNKAFYLTVNPENTEEMNEALEFATKAPKFAPWWMKAKTNVGDFFQQFGISVMDAVSHVDYAVNDMYELAGLDPEEGRKMQRKVALGEPIEGLTEAGNTFVSVMSASRGGMMPMRDPIHPSVVKELREEYLPFYNTSITDVESFAELMTKGGDGLAQSLPITSLFMLRPELGLAAVAATSYGSALYEIDEKIKLAIEAGDAGAVREFEQLKLAEMSKSDARAHALSLAATETAITRVFTYNFFRKAMAAKNFAGTKNAINAQKLANAYGKDFYATTLRRYSTYLGISPSAMATELTEEEAIALSRMAIEQAWGLKEYTHEEMMEYVESTGLNSLFSSIGLSQMAAAGHRRNYKNVLNQTLQNNIIVDNEARHVQRFVDADKLLKQEQGKENPNQEVIAGLEDVVSREAEVLSTFRKRKQELTDRMNNDDKLRMINLLADAERYQKSVENSKDDVEKNAAMDKLDDLRDEMKGILLQYPSEVSYEYAEAETKQKYEAMAMVSFREEQGLEEGETVTGVTEEQIKKRTVELWMDDVVKGKEKNNEPLVMLPGFRVSELGDYVPKYSESTYKDFTLSEQLGMLLERNEKLFQSLDNELQTDNYVPDNEQDQYIFNHILDDLKYYSENSDFMSSLDGYQRDIIVDFFKDTKSRRPNLAKVDNLLQAYNIAQTIKAESGGKIDIFGNQDASGNMVFEAVLEFSQRMYAGNISAPGQSGRTLATTDILMETLFRDQRMGTPFFDLNSEMGRVVAEVDQKENQTYKEHLEAYEKDALEDMAAEGGSKLSKDEITNPNGLMNSYELAILGSLYRLRDGDIPAGNKMDAEFRRVKNLIRSELALRKAEYENAKERGEDVNAAATKYEALNELYNRLGIADATNYAQVIEKASPRNVKAIERMAGMQDAELAERHIRDYQRFEPTMMVKYLPMFYKLDGESYGDMFGPRKMADGTANQMKDVTLPDGLEGNNLRLDMAQYFDHMYGSHRGMMLDAKARGAYKTMSYLMDMPAFQEIFSGNMRNADGSMDLSRDYQTFRRIFKNREAALDQMIQSSHINTRDVGDVSASKDAFKSILPTAYSVLTANTLVKLSQNMQQFQSAVSGAQPMLHTPGAKAYLAKKNAQFYAFSNNINSGNDSRGVGAGTILSSIPGLGNAYAKNIYAKSQTGLRNSLDADLIIQPNKKYPLSYYAELYRIPEATLEREIGGKTVKEGLGYTFSQFTGFLENSANLSLEIFLANGDLAAANSTFEAFYLDHRLRNGADIDGEGGIRAFWERENANPDIEAINYADRQVGRSQRLSTPTSEAQIYSKFENDMVKNGVRMLIPFSRFTFNVRSDIANQMRVLNDPNISEAQKADARRILRGKFNEVATFGAIRTVTLQAILKGTAGVAGLLGVEDEDIEREGGITQLVGAVAPIESRDIKGSPDQYPLRGKETTVEEQKIRANIELVETQQGIGAAMKDVLDASMVYENKLDLSNYQPQPLQDLMQETVSTMIPVPRPSGVDEIIAYGLNAFAENANIDVELREFVSNDIESSKTIDGFVWTVVNNLGLGSIGLKEAGDVIDAYNLMNEGVKYKYFPTSQDKRIKVGITGSTYDQREQIEYATRMLFVGHLIKLSLPVPRSDFDKALGRLERALEDHFDAQLTEDGVPVGEYRINNRVEDFIPFMDGQKDINRPERRNLLDEDRQ